MHRKKDESNMGSFSILVINRKGSLSPVYLDWLLLFDSEAGCVIHNSFTALYTSCVGGSNLLNSGKENAAIFLSGIVAMNVEMIVCMEFLHLCRQLSIPLQ